MSHDAKNRSHRLLRHRLLPLSALALLLAPMAVVVAQAQDQEPPDYTLAPDGVAVPRAVGPGKSAGVAGGVAGGGAVDVGGVASPQATSPLVGMALAQVLGGTMTLQEAWEQKLLSRDDLIRLLSRERLESVPGGQQRRIRTGLAGLLAELLPAGEAALQEAAQWNSPLRLSLADYYRSVHDQRAVALYQGLLSELDEQVKKSGPLKHGWVLPLKNLARFYAENHNPVKAAQTWERAENYSQDPEWVADSSLEAGRAFQQIGDEKKAAYFYSKADAQHINLFLGIVNYDRANLLLAADKPEAARDLVVHTLPSLIGADSRIGSLWVLAQAQGQMEAWPQAEATLKELLEACSQSRREGVGVDVISAAAEARLQVIQDWKNKSFDLPLTILLSSRDEQGLYHAKLYVHSLDKQPVQIQFDSPAAQLVELKQQSQRRAPSGVLVSIYDVSYRIASHPAKLAAQVVVSTKPQAQKPIEFRPRDDDGE